jgi:hypothetical protein
MKRRAAIEPVRAPHGPARPPRRPRINAVLAAVAYNFSLLLRWLATLAAT